MNEERMEEQSSTTAAPSNRWLSLAAFLLVCATVLSVVYAFRERRYARQLAASQDQMSATLNQTRNQLEALTAKLNAIGTPAATEPVSSATQRSAAGAGHVAAKRTIKKPRVAEHPRWKKIQEQLDEQQKQMAATQQDIEKTRTDLEGKLNSARDELGGSIARTHEELVALEKKGERNYYEFDMTKSKQFQRVGPISLSLRKTNTKKEHYDVVMLVDDFQLTKKHVNLYEPVLIYPADSPQALELVVNRIDKDQVHGYVSEPKYRQTQSAASASTGGESSSTPTGEATLTHRPETPR